MMSSFPPDKFQVLERNWRRVASTHTLQDLLQADDGNDGESGRLNVKTLIWGFILFLTGFLCLGVTMFAFAASSVLQPSKNVLLEALRTDQYYHLLVPLMVPITIVTIFFNWFSMKLFKHNS